MRKNIILGTDGYKGVHHNLYPKGTQRIYAYLESRGGKYNKTMFFGLQYYLKEYLEGKVVTKEKIDEAEVFWNKYYGRKDCFDRSKWEYILEKHEGRLPIKIDAVPEGTICNTSVVLTNGKTYSKSSKTSYPLLTDKEYKRIINKSLIFRWFRRR